jgi:YesN/AraC family two-component response regulator
MHLKKNKVLVIDDNPVFVSSFIRLVYDAVGKQIETINYSYSGIEALKLLNEHIYDYVFIDIDMPDMNGIDLAKQYDNQKFLRKTRFIAISFHEEFEFKQRMIEAGVFDYIIKDNINHRSIAKVFRTKE